MMKKIINFKNFLDIKKVISLTKVLCKDYFENLPIRKGKNSTQSNLFKICIIIAMSGLAYLSYYIINLLEKIGQVEIFLNVYLLVMAIIIIFQQILASTNVYYFSKDLEYILPFPIKPIELLIARFNMLVSISYTSIIMFVLLPLLIYGMMASTSLLYYVGMLVILVSFPIFFALIISIVMLFVMQLTKIIKNKELFQFVVTMILVFIFTIFEIQAITTVLSNSKELEQIQQGEAINLIEVINNKIEHINNYLVTVNPSIKILTGNNILKNIIELIKIIFVNIVAFMIFIFIGKQLYLKNILKNIQKVNINKIKDKKQNYKYDKINKEKAYIKNEIRELIKTPAFFMQCIFPTIFMVITLTTIIVSMYPSLLAVIQNEQVAEIIPEFKFNISILTAIIVIIQILFTFSNLSITAISRKGKNAFFIKYIPISFYKQFLYMNLPQIILNIFISLIVLGAAKYLMPQISIIYLIIMFIMGLILNIINSFLMLAVDLRRPNLEWDNETDAIKQNKNKLYQYVLTIIIILFLIYLQEILQKINLNLSIIIILFILIFILFLINKIIKNKINKLFNKIN